MYDIVRDELFSAHRGRGREPRRRADPASIATDLGHALVGTGFSYEPDRRRRQAEVLVHVLPRVRDIRRQGAAALDLCSVACGRLDAYYEAGLAPWDLAAGGVVATEAGAVVSDLAGGPPAPVRSWPPRRASPPPCRSSSPRRRRSPTPARTS